MESDLSNIKHILLDIEGTICPISFVKDTLFPYALKALPDIVHSKWDTPEFAKYKSAFPDGCQDTTEHLIDHVRDLTERNVKIAYFKDLQGYLWEEGYKSGAYSSPFFNDVVPALQRWKDAGIAISIYSSGSVFAQKLLFGHVNANDPKNSTATVNLRPLISDWFDTTNAGPKMDWKSYTKICQALEVLSTEVLFFSDNVKELEAAREAKVRVALVSREGNEDVSAEDKTSYGIIETFKELNPGKGNRKSTNSVQGTKRRLDNDVVEASQQKSTESTENGLEDGLEDVGSTVTPRRKKRKTANTKAKLERPSPQRRSRRLQGTKG